MENKTERYQQWRERHNELEDWLERDRKRYEIVKEMITHQDINSFDIDTIDKAIEIAEIIIDKLQEKECDDFYDNDI